MTPPEQLRAAIPAKNTNTTTVIIAMNVDQWQRRTMGFKESLDRYDELLRHQGYLTYTGRVLDDYPLEDSDDSI